MKNVTELKQAQNQEWMPQQIYVNHVLHAIMIIFNLYYDIVETLQRNISAHLTWMGVHLHTNKWFFKNTTKLSY